MGAGVLVCFMFEMRFIPNRHMLLSLDYVIHTLYALEYLLVSHTTKKQGFSFDISMMSYKITEV